MFEVIRVTILSDICIFEVLATFIYDLRLLRHGWRGMLETNIWLITEQFASLPVRGKSRMVLFLFYGAVLKLTSVQFLQRKRCLFFL